MRIEMQHDHQEIIQALQTIIEPGAVFEVRCLDAVTPGYKKPHTEAGYFDDPQKAAAAIGKLDAKGVYVTANSVKTDLLARAANRLKAGERGLTTSDPDVTRRRWLLVDVDPVRPSGISATDAEKAVALARVRQVFAHLRGLGWPDPITADSGNGYHLLYRIDEPAEDEHLVQKCLAALAAQFDDDQAAIDKSVFNPARIIRLYGTIAAKGDHTSDRPHRQSKVIRVPDPLGAAPHDLLSALAATIPTEEPRQVYTGRDFDIHQWIAEHLPNLLGEVQPWNGSGWKRWFHECPFNGDHKSPDSFIGQRPDGAIVAQCSHSTCKHWKWKELREKFDPAATRRSTTPKPATTAQSPRQAPDAHRITLEAAVKSRLAEYRRGPIPRVALGIEKLDRLLQGGVPYGSFVVVGALSSHGKTAFALQCCHWITREQKQTVLFVSVEMSPSDLADRTLQFASDAPKENWHQLLERLEQDSKDHFRGAAPCTLVEGLSTLPEIEAEILRAFKDGCRVVIVDYAQLIDAAGREDTNATMRRVSATFKRLAKDHQAIVLCLAQVNKRVESREPMVPRLTDIEYGTKLGHDSDVTLFLIWPHKVDTSKPANEYQIFIEKNRNGQAKCAIQCRFNPPRQTITEAVERKPANYEYSFDKWNSADDDDTYSDRKGEF
jgi:KaiC/GvpD/RAD55 family RecA-like ATPase